MYTTERGQDTGTNIYNAACTLYSVHKGLATMGSVIIV